MEEENDERSPRLTGVVIITLPPPDNPSFGKTITAFTLSDHHPQSPQLDQPQSAPQAGEAQTPLQVVPQNHGPQSLFSFGSPRRTLLPVLGISLIALYICVSISQEAFFQLKDELGSEDDPQKNKSQHTFIFTLYQKRYWGNSGLGDFELKLGRLTSIDSRSFSEELGDELSRGRINPKTASTASKIDVTDVIPVGGNIYPDGLYYTYLHFGNPPRPYFLDMDTGSALTWIQCDAPCTSCAKGAHPFYKPVKANIIPPKDSFCVEIQKNQIAKDCDSCNQCDYEIEYADHSSSVGVLARDELYLTVANGSLAQSKIVFGCAYDQQGLLLNTLRKTDGILGLSRAKISLPSQLASQGIIKNVIGHCLAADARGGVPYWQMAWVPMLQSYDLNSYQTNIVKVSYGSRQIGLGNVRSGQGRLVFDTGSSYSYFTEEAYNNLVAIFNDIPNESLVRDMSDTSLPICWRAKSPLRSVEDVRQFFKPLNLQFGSKWWIVSTKLQIPPEGYLVVNSKGNVCLGILNGREVHDGSTFILGDISLRGLLFVYDNVKGKIGWVRSDCARPRKFVTDTLY
ncbi:aspartyl protease APCB1 [Sesamum indicum]|uniref:Aspartyl protease APCB1 n=1 Tax=Sesamum indicum TaxID=4182 RepID=A0A6I9U803_SESIN|nr:aspartyl protease APCB1 [Sesamum indicum]